MALEQVTHAVREIGKQHADDAERDAGDERGQQPERRRMRNERDDVERVMNAERTGNDLADDGGDEAREDRVVAHAPDGEHFQPEHRTGERRTEDRGKAGADARHQQNPPLFLAQFEELRNVIGERAGHLHRRPFTPGRAAEEVRDRRRDQDRRRHALGHHALRIVDLVDQEIVPALDRLASAVIKRTDREAGDGQQPEQPRVRRARVRRPIERDDEQRRRQSAEHANQGGEQQPAAKDGQQAQLRQCKSIDHVKVSVRATLIHGASPQSPPS